ncbi:hypothetical protein ERO13_D10G032200v2 [Gossypium hirsutum]|uniref:Uncharacterized protein isoform X1 n=1 Tax=Gossypium hirsutum TaxID=3635 RepID=A0ABM3AV31_GOSHI|nr:uncharacterized protein LOC121222304 isoform X1 [Gossypium hirsutum]KAG4124308.1 hypothetical protein ERO13_D10G032200v2 [Gossypium hirsutum]
MEKKAKGIAWVGNLYQKFEAMCIEVDDMVCQETLRYVENQLQTVGSNVKQFCTELMQDLVASSTDSLEDLNTVQIAGVAASVDSNGSANEDHSQTKLVDSSSVKSVEDVHLGLPSEQITEDQNSLAHSKGFTAPGSLILSKAFKNELKDNDSTADDTLLESMEPEVKMGPARLLEAYHKSVLKMEPEVPSFDNTKLEESCIIVDRIELLSVSNNVGKHRSYKKKLQDAFSSKSRFTKRDDEQHALSRQRNKRESQDMEFCESDWEII